MWAADFHRHQNEADFLRRGSDILQHRDKVGAIRVRQQSDTRQVGYCRGQQLHLFRGGVILGTREARRITAGAGQTRDKAIADGIDGVTHHDGCRTGRLLDGTERCRRPHNDDIDFQSHELGGKFGIALRFRIRKTPLHDEVLVLHIAMLAHALLESAKLARLQ